MASLTSAAPSLAQVKCYLIHCLKNKNKNKKEREREKGKTTRQPENILY